MAVKLQCRGGLPQSIQSCGDAVTEGTEQCDDGINTMASVRSVVCPGCLCAGDVR